MSAGVVTVGRQSYAVGLYWENSPGSGRVAQIAKEAANQAGQQADFFAIRPSGKGGRIAQFGLSSAEAGHKTGMPVLAACLANQIPGSWAGAFRLSEGIVIIIVRDDLIVPDGDLFFIDEAEARDRLIQEMGFGGLQSTYAPESWSLPSADSIPLSLLLNDRHDIKLQSVKIPANVKLAALVLCVLMIVSVGGALWWQSELEAERAARAREAALQAASKRLMPKFLNQEAPAPVYDRVWEKQPAALAIVNACRQALSDIPVGLAGWRMNGLKCTGSNVTVSWGRLKGFSMPPPDTVISPAASTAVQSLSLPAQPPRGAEILTDPNVITARYLEQNWPGSVSRAPDDPLPPAPPGYEKNWNPPPAPWVKRSFTLHVPILPGEIPIMLGELPGVVITAMNYAPGSQMAAWSIEGVIYENRK